jgi:formylmethanofuran dehydrogenase subunit B
MVYYTIKETKNGYGVIVWIPLDYKDGHPRFAPGSSAIVELRKDLTVERYLPGY